MGSGLLDIRRIVWSIDHTSTPCRVCKIPQDLDAQILDGICVDCAMTADSDDAEYYG